jgi:hypothetical protein
MKKSKKKNMKILKFLIIVCMVFANSGCQAQNEVDDKQAMAMLKEFYTVYNTEWATNKNITLKKNLDSLQDKYCTARLINKLREPNLDHDMFIKDLNTDVEHLTTLTITKDSTKANTYIVSYKAPNTDPRGNDYIDQVVIHATVVKEKDRYKIDDIK